MGLLEKALNVGEGKQFRQYEKRVSEIASFEDQLVALSDEELRGRMDGLRERVREQGVLEHFQWYCLECSALVHDVEVQVNDISADLPRIFEAFYADEAARTCPACGALHPGKG